MSIHRGRNDTCDSVVRCQRSTDAEVSLSPQREKKQVLPLTPHRIRMSARLQPSNTDPARPELCQTSDPCSLLSALFSAPWSILSVKVHQRDCRNSILVRPRHRFVGVHPRHRPQPHRRLVLVWGQVIPGICLMISNCVQGIFPD